jgi:hypothetical protein
VKIFTTIIQILHVGSLLYFDMSVLALSSNSAEFYWLILITRISSNITVSTTFRSTTSKIMEITETEREKGGNTWRALQ